MKETGTDSNQLKFHHCEIHCSDSGLPAIQQTKQTRKKITEPWKWNIEKNRGSNGAGLVWAPKRRQRGITLLKKICTKPSIQERLCIQNSDIVKWEGGIYIAKENMHWTEYRRETELTIELINLNNERKLNNEFALNWA